MAAVQKHQGNLTAAAHELNMRPRALTAWVNKPGRKEWYEKMKKEHGWKKRFQKKETIGFQVHDAMVVSKGDITKAAELL